MIEIPPGPRLLEGRLLHGANVHHRATVFSQRVAPGALTGRRVDDAGAEFGPRFTERFSGLDCLVPAGCPAETGRAAPAAGGRRLTELLLQAILAVERFVARAMCRLDAPEFSRLVDRDDAVELVWESHSARISRAAARAALSGLVELLPPGLAGHSPPAPDYSAAMAELRRWCRRRQWSTTTAVVAMAARRRGLPHELLAGHYLRVGEGVMQQVVSRSALDPGRGAGAPASAGASRGPSDRAQIHRLLVIGGELVSALRCDPPAIVGDGTHTIAELIERLNHDPLRNDAALPRVPLDERLRSDLAGLGLDPDHMLPQGERLALPGVRTVARGAIPVDVTGTVHPSVRDAALLAAGPPDRRIVSLEFLTGDITRSCRAGGGRVIATLPADPFVHALPGHRRAGAVGDAVLALLFPAGLPAPIPTALVVGDRGTRAVARELDRVLLRTGLEGVGLVTRDQMTIQGRPLDSTSLARRRGPRFLLGDPRAGLVVGALAPRTIVERGLGLERCSVTAFLDPSSGGPLARYRAAVEIGVGATTDAVVIGAANPCLALVLDAVGPERVVLVARRGRHPAVSRHLAAGGFVVRPGAGPGAAVELRRSGSPVITMPIASPAVGPFTAGLVFALGVPGGTPGAERPARDVARRVPVRALADAARA